MIKNPPLNSYKHWEHAAYPGGSFSSATEAINSGKLRIGGRRVALVHMGTNPIDVRGWQDRIPCERRLAEIMQEVKLLYSAIRARNATCFIIFSSVLPRPVDWVASKRLCIDFNKALRSFARSKKCGFLPSYTSFIVKEAGPLQGEPLPGLWARRDGGLHLNLNGRYIMNERLKSALHVRQLGVMARQANFPHWR